MHGFKKRFLLLETKVEMFAMHSSTFGGNQTPHGHRGGGGMMIWAPCSGRVNPNLLCNTVGSILEAICPTAKALLNLDHEPGQ